MTARELDDTKEPQWLGAAGAACLLGVTDRTVHRAINRGDLTAYRVGRVIRIRRVDVDRFLDAHQIQPGDLDHLLSGDGRHASSPDESSRSR